MPKKGKPENILILDLSQEFGSPLAILRDSNNFILSEGQVDVQGEKRWRSDAYFPINNWPCLFSALRSRFLKKNTAKAKSLGDLCTNVQNVVRESDAFIEGVAKRCSTF